MPNQEIGVDSVFETRQFSRGLNRYLAGLKQATTETMIAATAINSFAATSNQAIATMLHTAQGTVRSINQLTAAIKAANAAAAASRVPRRISNATAALPTTAGGGQQATAQVNQATRATQRYGNAARKAQGDVRGLTTASGALAVTVGTLAAQAIQAGIRGFISMGRTILETVTFFERMDISIEFFAAQSARAADRTLTFDQALAQTQEQAEALAYWLRQLAIASPFTTREVSTIFRTAQAYGLTRQEAELLTPLLLDFAAATGLTGDVLERLALAFGQVRSRGKLTGEEVRQLGNSGLPIRDILVEALGIANEEFDELLESGALTSDVVLPAMINALKDFEGAGKRVSFETIGGLVSAFEELKEISTAEFFRGVLGPLTEEFQQFFKVVNRPQTLAFIKILGEEVGGKLLAVFKNTAAAVKDLTQQWIALDPVMKQQILIFGATFAIVIALAGAIGLLTVSIRLLTNPVVLVATAIAFLVSEYSSGFAVLNSVTGGFIKEFAKFPSAIGGGIASAIRFVGQGVGAIGRFFGDLGSDMAGYGAKTVSAFAEGAIGAANALVPIFTEIARMFTFWLAPGSPPRVAPDIDKFGRDTMQEYFNAFAEANPETPINRAGEIMTDSLKKMNEDVLQRFNELNPESAVNQYGVVLTKGVADGLSKASKEARGIGKALANDEVLSEASEAGIQTSEAYVNSFIENMRVLIPPMSEELRKILDRIGSGRQLSLSGAFAFNQFLDGFKLADFDILGDATSIVQDVLQSLVDIGELDEIDLARQVFGSSEAIAKAVEEFRRAGRISEQTLSDVGRASGKAGGFVVDLLRNYQQLAIATDRAEAAQDELNRVTKHYDDILKPLKAQLDAINETVTFKDEEERILSLRRLIANQGVSDRRRSTAQAQIDQILAERRVRNLETERKTAIDAAEETLKAREEEREALQEQFSLLQARINAQLEQLSLVSQEGSIIKGLQEEAAKLREKQKTESELQLELLRLQKEEIDDTVKAARAKYVLDQADSTELEKQQAILDLQEVALNRRNRLLEAAEFGIPASELTKFRDLVVTLDDIGKKSKEKFTSDFAGITEGLVDVKSITEEIDKATAEVRKRWEEVKEQIKQTLAEINANLPSFLRILPTEEGGAIPLIDTLIKFGDAILIVAGIMTATRIVKLITSFTLALRGLFALFGGSAAAAGAAGAGAGAGAAGAAGAAGGLKAFGAAIKAFALRAGAAAIVIGALATAFIAVAEAIKALGEHPFGRTMIDSTTPLDIPMDDLDRKGPLIEGDIFANPFAKQKAPEPADMAPFQDSLKNTVATVVSDAVAGGLTEADIAGAVMKAVSDGVKSGLLPDDPEIKQNAAAYMNTLIQAYREAGEIESPSKLSKREIGLPWGQGILDGIKESLAGGTGIGSVITGSLSALIKVVQAVATTSEKELTTSFEATRTKVTGDVTAMESTVNARFTSLSLKLTTASRTLKDRLKLDWESIRSHTTTTATTMQTSVTASFGTLHRNIITAMGLIKGVVVSSFVAMRTESETEIGKLIERVIELFAGEEESLLADLRLALLGTDLRVPRQIGLDFMRGIGLGMLEGQKNLSTVMASAIGGALRSAGNSITPELGITAATQRLPLTSRVSTTNPGYVSNVTRTQNFYLTVQTARQSQGVINDFGIMRTLGE